MQAKPVMAAVAPTTRTATVKPATKVAGKTVVITGGSQVSHAHVLLATRIALQEMCGDVGACEHARTYIFKKRCWTHQYVNTVQ